jgi:hypothetical protein
VLALAETTLQIDFGAQHVQQFVEIAPQGCLRATQFLTEHRLRGEDVDADDLEFDRRELLAILQELAERITDHRDQRKAEGAALAADFMRHVEHLENLAGSQLAALLMRQFLELLPKLGEIVDRPALILFHQVFGGVERAQDGDIGLGTARLRNLLGDMPARPDDFGFFGHASRRLMAFLLFFFPSLDAGIAAVPPRTPAGTEKLLVPHERTAVVDHGDEPLV